MSKAIKEGMYILVLQLYRCSAVSAGLLKYEHEHEATLTAVIYSGIRNKVTTEVKHKWLQ